jgi:Xaa-Pro aminopeptidase
MIHEVGEVVILIHNTKYTVKNRGIIFCDPRTSGLFDATVFEVVSDREKWGYVLHTYGTLQTDPDALTQTLREQMEGYGVTLTMAPSPIAEKRIIKTPEEIEKLTKSQSINKAVYVAIQPFLIPGVTERDIARRIQILQLELGATGPSFTPIVAFGENTAVPHHSPTHRVLQSGDVVLIDMGVIYEGYCSDMTRCCFV